MATKKSTTIQRRKHKKSVDPLKKWCPQCEQFLNIDRFSKNKTRVSGLESSCKSCSEKRNTRLISRYKSNIEKNQPREKQCSICREVFPVENFYKNSSMKNGLDSACTSCNKEKVARQRLAFRQGIIPFQVKTEKKCDHCKNVLPIHEFYENRNTKDGRHGTCASCCRLRKKQEYDANPQKQRDKTLRWAKANPEKVRFSIRKREANIKNAAVCDLTKPQWEYIKHLYNYRCIYCDKKKPLTRDHVIPIVDGGGHTMPNIVPACRPCNSRKGRGKPPRPVQTMMKLAI